MGPQQFCVGRYELVLCLAEFSGARLTVQSIQEWLWVERLKVARTAGHEQENDRLCLSIESVRFRHGSLPQ
jgi:hypothetical protein